MAVVDVHDLTYRYGAVTALRELTLSVPDGALYALIGPNGSGKTTLMQILMGLRRPRAGTISLLGIDSRALTMRDRATIGYIAEGQVLPRWMRLEQLEEYLAPFYPTWDRALARNLRERFELDPARKIGALSRGDSMKAALLCALAPRPRLLIMDEPFTGMDAVVKDELVRGLLESAGTEGWTVLVCSHDIGELELLADWVGFLAAGRMELSEPMDVVRQRFKRVDVTASDASSIAALAVPNEWMSVDRGGAQLSFVVDDAGDDVAERVVQARIARTERVDVRPASLREVFVAIAGRSRAARPTEVVA